MWLSKSPNGPAIKFLVEKITSLSELKLSGNSLKYGRALISFDKHFDELPHLQLAKEMLKSNEVDGELVKPAEIEAAKALEG